MLLKLKFALFCLFLTFINTSATDVDVWLTSSDLYGNATKLINREDQLHNKLTKVKTGLLDSDILININLDQTLQQMIGFGAGLPQSSAYSLFRLKERSSDLYWQVLGKLFSTESDSANMNILRFPVGSCDFSISNTSYDEYPQDFELTHFAIDSDSLMIVSVLQDVVKINPKLILIASPWSAPSWLKTWNTLIGWNEKNTLIDSDQVYTTYAKYFGKVVQAFAHHGLTIQYLTLQNEPLFGDNWQYPGMFLSADDAGRLLQAVKKEIGNRAKVLAYDHNWDHPEYPLSMIAAHPDKVAGTAWHCYGGDMATALDTMHTSYPHLEQHITECTGSYPDSVCDLSRGMENFGGDFGWDMHNIMLGATSHWAQSGVKWILALDEHCGPTLPDVQYTWGRPLVSVPSYATSMDDIKFNVDYWSVAQMSRFVHSGSHRVASTQTIQTDKNLSVLTESFVDSGDGDGQITTYVVNSDQNKSISVHVSASDGSEFAYTLAPSSTVVFQWKK